MLNGLQDIRLPPGGAFDGLADLLAAAGLGLAIAACLVLLLSLGLKAAPRRRPSAHARLDALRALPEDQRVPALLMELSDRDRAAAQKYREAAYKPGPLPSADDLEDLIRKAS